MCVCDVTRIASALLPLASLLVDFIFVCRSVSREKPRENAYKPGVLGQVLGCAASFKVLQSRW